MELEKLYQRRSDILKELAEVDKRETAAGKNYLEHEDYARLNGDLEKLGTQITVLESAEEDRKRRTDLEKRGRQSKSPGLEPQPSGQGDATKKRAVNRYRTLGEQLVDVIRVGRHRDEEARSRLTEVRAPTGLGTEVGEDGGFLVQEDEESGIWRRTYEQGEILRRVRKFPISGNANSTKLHALKETSRANGSRWGGVRVYRANEAGTVTATKPKLEPIRFELEKLMALVYLSQEQLEDAPQIEAVVREVLPEEMAFAIENEIINGNGVGQSLGVMNSPAKVAVSAETGQTAATVVAKNIIKMRARMWARSRRNSLWVCNQDIEPQLDAMALPIGTGGVPVYLPANGLRDARFDTLYGRSVVPVEYCQTLGTAGDLIYLDPTQYAIAEKGGINVASSIHVRFLYDESVLRFTWRIIGAPLWQSALTPFKGSDTLSPFVTLETRS